MMNKLEPCPFCGHQAIRWREKKSSVQYYAVVCSNFIDGHDYACYASVAPESALFDTVEKADNAWNKRAKTQNI